MGSHALLQGIFLIQGSNAGLLHCRQILYCLSHQGSPFIKLPWWLGGKESACNAGDVGLIPGSARSLEKEMATHSSILAWRTPCTEEPGGLQSTGSQSRTRPSDLALGAQRSHGPLTPVISVLATSMPALKALIPVSQAGTGAAW